MGFQGNYVIENVLSQFRNFSSPTSLLNLEINNSYRVKNIFNFDLVLLFLKIVYAVCTT